jgi:hypothetical protein
VGLVQLKKWNLREKQKKNTTFSALNLLVQYYGTLITKLFLSLFRIGMEDGDDIEAIYNQERERETAATGGEGDVEPASRELHGGGEQSSERASSKQLSARVKAFLDKCNSVKSQNSESAVSGPTKICDTVKNLKQQMLDAPGLHGGVYSISADTGCFKLSSEA